MISNFVVCNLTLRLRIATLVIAWDHLRPTLLRFKSLRVLRIQHRLLTGPIPFFRATVYSNLQSLSSSIILVQEDQHRIDASTRAMINLDLKKLKPNERIQDRDSALLFFRQWRVYVNAGGTKSLRLLLEKPTDPKKIPTLLA